MATVGFEEYVACLDAFAPERAQRIPSMPGRADRRRRREATMNATPQEEDGRRPLHEHILDNATATRIRYGRLIDTDAILRMLDDRRAVRYPTRLRFDAGPLQTGEFAHARLLGSHPREGYCLFVHAWFEPQRDIWPLLIAYHIPVINYGASIITDDEAELFGATLLGLEREAYYQALCELTDSIPA